MSESELEKSKESSSENPKELHLEKTWEFPKEFEKEKPSVEGSEKALAIG